MPGRAIFLDCDGTLVEEVGYLRRLQDLRVLPHTLEALSRINTSGSLAIVVTNQSAIARGLLSEDELCEIHGSLSDLCSRQGARIDAFYYCPHHPREGEGPYRRECDCRKPKPGLLVRAADDLKIDLKASHLVGDRLRDVEAGHQAGCQSVLLRTGYGIDELNLMRSGESESNSELKRPDFVAEHILEGVAWILEQYVER